MNILEKIQDIEPEHYQDLTKDEIEEVMKVKMDMTYSQYPYNPEEFINEHESDFLTASEICSEIDERYNKVYVTEALVNEWWNGAALYRENENLKNEIKKLKNRIEVLESKY